MPINESTKRSSYFCYDNEKLWQNDQQQYHWKRTQGHAQNVLGNSGLLPVQVTSGQTLYEFCPFILAPSPMQDYARLGCACRVPLQSSAQINHLLEDITGVGKPEAAVMLNKYNFMFSSNHVHLISHTREDNAGLGRLGIDRRCHSKRPIYGTREGVMLSIRYKK